MTVSPDSTSEKPKLGLVLGSGAARGWAHIGVLQALDEMGVEPDIYAGCSAGALVSGAKLLGILEDLEKWALELKPLGAMKDFAFTFSRGGVLDPAAAFDSFRGADKLIEELDVPFAANATDIGTGEEVWLTQGSVIDAAKASTAIPLIFRAARMPGEHGDRWLVDGALSNPVPVDLARSLGADKVIAVDVNAISRSIRRFNSERSTAVIVRPDPTPAIPENPVLPTPLANLIANTRAYVDQRAAVARARMKSKPHFFETATAAADIFQAQLAEAKAQIHPPDIRLTPDLRHIAHAAFDRAEEIIDIGYQVTMQAKEDILALEGKVQPQTGQEDERPRKEL
jgi:NTE family protein